MNTYASNQKMVSHRRDRHKTFSSAGTIRFFGALRLRHGDAQGEVTGTANPILPTVSILRNRNAIDLNTERLMASMMEAEL